ncbi:hypothetical protein LTR56_004205 [Elasticomyces elasticus]|nr:hypothetical protein LTR56_004205 [Elasticomyces elasticus]KAK3655094.1 hypothetical protein LTR22_010404 [Elasticomyces elasticus]KAK4910889.1 hypothetical protein LTR49_020501 [Elasticomyces elasticus]KAK5750308.1 hypothetical protein LTS12_019647 [Elasticomyces elasticus]
MAATKQGNSLCHPAWPPHRTIADYKDTSTLQFLKTCSLADLKTKCRERRILVSGPKRALVLRLDKDTVQAAVYDGRSVGPLLDRIVERKLIFWGAVSSADLVAILEAADLARTFHRFQELPAELRNMHTQQQTLALIASLRLQLRAANAQDIAAGNAARAASTALVNANNRAAVATATAATATAALASETTRADAAEVAYDSLLEEILKLKGVLAGRKRKRNDGEGEYMEVNIDDSGIGGDMGEEGLNEIKRVEDEEFMGVTSVKVTLMCDEPSISLPSTSE